MISSIEKKAIFDRGIEIFADLTFGGGDERVARDWADTAASQLGVSQDYLSLLDRKAGEDVAPVIRQMLSKLGKIPEMTELGKIALHREFSRIVERGHASPHEIRRAANIISVIGCPPRYDCFLAIAHDLDDAGRLGSDERILVGEAVELIKRGRWLER
jgi:hypothetical protein